jgi:hypothetical protein
MLHSFDLKKADHGQLSKAATVIATLEKLLPVENPPVVLRKLGIWRTVGLGGKGSPNGR